MEKKLFQKGFKIWICVCLAVISFLEALKYYKNQSEKVKDALFLRANNHIEGWHHKFGIGCNNKKPKLSLSLEFIKKELDDNEQSFKTSFCSKAKKLISLGNIQDSIILKRIN